MPRFRSQLMRHVPVDKWALIGNRALAMADGAVTEADLDAFVAAYGLGSALGPASA